MIAGDPAGPPRPPGRRTDELNEYAAASERRARDAAYDVPILRRRSARVIAWVSAAVVVSVLLMAVGYVVRGGSVDTPATESAEAGFARDMQIHHAQAVEMALTIRDKTSDPELRAVAYDIITTQQHQIGQMYAWLNQWGLPQSSSEPAMLWMADAGSGHDMLLPDGRMPGMASSADLSRLSRLEGVAAEVLFLQLMITHHQAGIDMAQALLSRSDRPEVTRLAEAIEKSQALEITAMENMLATRGAPAPSPGTDDTDDMGDMPGMDHSSSEGP